MTTPTAPDPPPATEAATSRRPTLYPRGLMVAVVTICVVAAVVFIVIVLLR